MLNLSVICPDLALKIRLTETKAEFLRFYGDPEINEDTPFVFLGSVADGYEIIFNQEKIIELYQNSWLIRYTDYEVLIDGFIIKQLARLRYSANKNTFDEIFQAHLLRETQSPLYYAVYETIFSYMAEYRLCYDFPELSPTLEVLNSTVTYSYGNKLKAMGGNYTLYFPYIEALDRLLHYHAISEKVDIAFINFSLPFVLLAKRTGYHNVIEASLLIEEWLRDTVSVHYDRGGTRQTGERPEKEVMYEKDIRSVTDRELEEIDHEAVLHSVKSRVQDIAKEIGLQAGTGRIRHRINEANAFFLDTVQRYHKEISELKYMFRRVFTSMKVVDSFDGDINLRRLQDAYLSSITGEEMKIFQYYQKRKISVDIMILRDVSGSTYLFEKEYAEAIIMLLAAVDGFAGIRTLEIDFGGEAILNKDFSQSLDTASIRPCSGGGTSILPALAILRKQILRGRRRLLFILSDGEINDLNAADSLLEEMMQNDGVEVFKIALGELANHGYEYVHVKNLHKLIAKKILERGQSEDE